MRRIVYAGLVAVVLAVKGNADDAPKDPHPPIHHEKRASLVLADPAVIASYDALIRNETILTEIEGLSDGQDEHLDDLADVGKKREYIAKHKISFDNLVGRMNKSDVILFGQVHRIREHDETIRKCIQAINKHSLAYASESFSLDNQGLLMAYMSGEDVSAKIRALGWWGQEMLNDLQVVRNLDIPILVTDLGIERKRAFGDYGANPHVRSIRDRFTAQAVDYAREQGHRVFLAAGDLHVQPDAIPSYLGDVGRVLRVSSGCFSREVFETAMAVSEGHDIFFTRGDSVYYVTQGLASHGPYKR